MKRCMVLLVCFITSTLYAGMQRQQPISRADTRVVESAKRAYTKDGEVDLEPIVDLKVGDNIAFKLGDEVVVATIDKRDTTAESGLIIIGTFIGHNKAGVFFQFTPKNVIKGVLFFTEKNAIYNLSLDETTGRVYFKRQEIAPRT